MENKFREVDPVQITDNTFKLIGDDWMLITAGAIERFNMMTASWGGLGILWNKKVCFTFVRPTRYTYNFTEKSDYFTLSFFEDKYRSVLDFCGSKSGRDVDKGAATGIMPVQDPTGAIYFGEARLVLVCKKIYYQDIEPSHFLDAGIDKNYPKKDYHRMYVGEIVKCLSI